MPVSPATVREAFVRVEPVAHDNPKPPVAGTGRDESSPTRARRLLLAGAGVTAFLIGFAVVTLLMRDADSASKPRSKTTATSVAPSAPAPARSAPARAPSSTPPPSALDAEPTGDGLAVPSPPPAAQMPQNDGPGAPAPTSAPPTTSPPTTTPATTAP